MERSRRNSLVTLIYDAAREVHNHTGSGILPSIFKSCLAHELRMRGVRFRLNFRIDVNYKGLKIEEPLVADFLVEDEVVIKLVTTPESFSFNQSELQTLLIFSGLQQGILLNIFEKQLVDGFKKVMNPNKFSL